MQRLSTTFRVHLEETPSRILGFVVALLILFGAGQIVHARPSAGSDGAPLRLAQDPAPRGTPAQALRKNIGRIHPVLSVSLFQPLALPWSSGYTVAGLSVNVLYGASHRLYGLEVGAGVNYVRTSTMGLQVAGLVNVVGERVHGLQLAGLYNMVYQGCEGVCIAGIGNYNVQLKGTLISGLFSYVRDKSGGVMIAGGANVTGAPFDGLQIAAASWTGGRFKGLQVGVLNRGRGVTGVQIGVANFSCGRMEGLQLGFFNFAQELRGVQIGAFNVSLRNGLPFMVGMNMGW